MFMFLFPTSLSELLSVEPYLLDLYILSGRQYLNILGAKMNWIGANSMLTK